MNDNRPSSTYIPALDGLRAIAVMLVFSLHLNIDEFPGGNAGVDIFFGLSGFLITSLLLKELDVTGTVSLKRFYIRRALRLFPALFFLLALYTAATVTFYPNWQEHIAAVLAALFYVSNWVIAFDVGPHGLMGLMHTWSLAVEEQFYLIWPPLLILALRRMSLTRLIWLTVLASLLSTIWRVYLVSKGATVDRVYCGFDTRLDCLAVGCVTAMLMHKSWIPARLRTILKQDWLMAIILASFLCVGAAFKSENVFMLSYGHTLVAILTCLLICGLLSAEHSTVNAFLSMTPLIIIGKLSYAIYLWHHPVLIFMRARLDLTGFPLFLAALVATGVVSAFSYYFIELRFLKLKERFTFSGGA